MTATRRRLLAFVAIALAAGAAGAWWQARQASVPAPRAATATAGGSLTATLRSEPATFNRYAGTAFPTHLVSQLTQARLVRINRVTQEVEPWLAERWTAAPDGRSYRIHLREGIRFSDGHPFTAEDVAFSFEAVYDARTGSPLGDALRVGGKPLIARASAPLVVDITFPTTYGPGLRVLDALPVYPRHRLAARLADGTFAKAWGPTTEPAEMVGLGPFVLTRYEPGQRLVFARNPHYWRQDRQGRPLPYLDALTLELVPDQNSELLRLQAGQVDLLQNELRPDDYLTVKQQADKGRLKLIDAGLGLDTHLLWFNLRARPRGAGRIWLEDDRFRSAVSHAVDREAFARTVYLGAAQPTWGLVSPANLAWYSHDAPRAPYDPERARALLDAANLVDRDGDGVREDADGTDVRFTLLVQKGVTGSEKGASVLRDALARVGVAVDVAALDLGAVMGRWSQGDYDAIYHYMSATDTDPAGNLDLWLSSGSAHVWNPGQRAPATPWEAEIDRLMRAQAASQDDSERRTLFAEVQRIIAERAPAMSFATPHVYLAASARVASLTPAVQRPQVLWNADMLAVTAPVAAAR